jgi:TonB family protein
LSDTVTDIIVSRSGEPDGLSRMVVWSIAAHAVAIMLMLLWPDVAAPERPREIMTISLGGAPGPKTGGLTQIGGREVQAAAPEPAKPVEEAPPAPKTPAMTLPDPKVRPRPQPKPERAPEDAKAQKVSTGEKPQAGSTRTETRGLGFSTGLSSTGGSGGPVQLDVINFCCPEYIEQMKVFIQRTWEQNQGVAGSTGVKFTIMRNGTIQAPQIEKPSGYEVLDLAAMRALQRTTLPPLPQEFSNPTLTVHMRFDYSR